MERLFSRVLSTCVLASIHAPANGEDEVRMDIYEQTFLFDGKTTGNVTRVVTPVSKSSPYGTGSRRNGKPRNTETAAVVEQFPVAHFSLLCYQVSHESAQAVHASSCLRRPLLLRRDLSGTGRTEGKKSLSEYMQDNKANSIANVPTGLLSTTPNQQQATHLTATTQEEMTRADSGAVYYTDAHDPDAPIPGLEEAFAQRKENERWIQSYPTALREAQSTGKPILIWFHHSVGSPPSKNLGPNSSIRRNLKTGQKGMSSASVTTRRKNLKANLFTGSARRCWNM